MGQAMFPALDVKTARMLAGSLDDVANRLGCADNPDAFLAALEDNGHVWEKVRRAAWRYGWRLPSRLLDFSLASAARARRGLSDHDVESLIAINRQVSSVIRSTSAPSIRPG